MSDFSKRAWWKHRSKVPVALCEEGLKAILQRAYSAAEGVEEEGGGPSGEAWDTCAEDVPALVAEVRRLRAREARGLELVRGFANECGPQSLGRAVATGILALLGGA